MAATNLFLRNTQTGGGTGGAVYDLSETQGSGATLSATVASNTFAEVLRFQITLGASLPATSIPFSISINAISANSEVRWRIQELNSSNTVVASSAYASTENSTGTKTGTISFTNSWANGDRLAISVEYRRTSGSGNRTVTIDVNNASSYIQPDLIAPTQVLTPALYTNTNTFYGPSVKGISALLPGLYTNNNVFYSPHFAAIYTVFATAQQDFGEVTDNPTQWHQFGLITDTPATYTNDLGDLQAGGATQSLTAALYTNTNTFYGPAVAATYALTPSRYDNTNTFYGPTVTASYTLTAARYDNTNTFYDPALTYSNTLTAARFDNTNNFYNLTVTSLYTIEPDRYDNTNTFYGPSITTTVTLTAARFDNNNTFYDHTVTAGAVTLLPELYENTNVFYGPVVNLEGGPQFVAPNLFINTNEFYEATLSVGEVELLASLVVNENTFYDASVTTSIELTASLYENDNVFYEPTVAVGDQVLFPDRFNNQNVFYLPTVTGGEVKPSLEGGSAGSKKRKRKTRRVYVERDGKIYVFASEAQAQAWVQALEQQQFKTKKTKVRKEAKELISPPLDKIEIGSAKELAEKYGKQPLITELIRSKEYDELVYQYKMLFALETAARFAELQEEEEITILLMAA